MSIESPFQLVTTYDICLENSELNSLLQQLEQCNSDSTTKNLIDKILNVYRVDHETPYVRNVVVEFFVRINARKHLLKYMYIKLKTPQIDGQSFFDRIVHCVLIEIQEDINLNKLNVKQCNWILAFLGNYIKNFGSNEDSRVFLPKVFKFYLCILEVFAYKILENYGKNEDCHTILYMTLKQFVSALPKPQKERYLEHCCILVIFFTHDILKYHKYLKFDTISLCLIVFSYFWLLIPQEAYEMDDLKYKKFPILNFVNNESSVILRNVNLAPLFENNRLKVALYLTIYNTIPSEELTTLKVYEKPILEHIFNNLIDLGKNLTNYADATIQISRTLDTMTVKLINSSNFSRIFHKGLEFVWSHLDHFVDHVTINTKSFLKKLLTKTDKNNLTDLTIFFKELQTMQISKVRLNAIEAISDVIDYNMFMNLWPQLPYQLLTLATTSPDNKIAGNAYINLMLQSLQKNTETETITDWIHPVLTLLEEPNLKYCKILEEIVMTAFKIKPGIFQKLRYRKCMSQNECIIILKFVHWLRMTGTQLKIEPEDNSYWRNFISKDKLDMFTTHENDEIRICTLQVIAECQKSTEAFTVWELQFLIRYFRFNISVQVANFRNKLVTYYKKILTRFHATSIKNTPNSEYSNFIRHFSQQLVANLGSDANYPRRSISLELLLNLHVIYNDWEKIFGIDDINNLKNLIFDSYETNKSLAIKILQTLSPEKIGFASKYQTEEFLQKAFDLTCDIRPSQSVSGCYLFQLVLHSRFAFVLEESSDNRIQVLNLLRMRIESDFDKNCENIVKAAENAPLYGMLQASRYLLHNRNLQEYNEYYSVIFGQFHQLCLKIQEHIMPIVANLSPEGYIPDGNDILDQSSTSQKILVYSWKTMKEIMLLFAEIVDQTIQLEKQNLLPESDIQKIGDFFIDVFIQTKHRGVFEQAHVAFSSICKSFSKSKNENLTILPTKWLNEAISLCTGEKIDDRLCPTRRSAGLPFLVLSIVPILSEINRDYLRRTIEPLLTTCRDSPDELRMHCLNVLRFMFKNSKLGDHIIIYIDRAVIAALRNYNSRIWGVRNSANLLLNALITRIFGISEENRMTLVVFQMRYPKLFEFLLNELEGKCEKEKNLVPVFMILSRLYPSHNDTINAQVMKNLPFIENYMKNVCYRTRDLAARASVSLISENLLKEQLDKDFGKLSGNLMDVECHGMLLRIHHIFQTTSFSNLPISNYLNQSKQLLKLRKSHLTITLYMDIVFMLLTKYPNFTDLEIFKEFIVLLSKMDTSGCITSRSNYTWSRFQLLLFISLNKLQCEKSITIIAQYFLRYLTGNDIEMKRKCLLFLIYLNQECSKQQFKEHPLIIAGDVEICPQIKILVDSFSTGNRKKLLLCLQEFLHGFFINELKQQTIDDLLVLVLLLLRFYPSFFEHIESKNTQKCFDWFLELANTSTEEVTSGVISCLVIFPKPKKFDYKKLIKILANSAKPASADFLRLTVAQFIVEVQDLIKSSFTACEKLNIFNFVMILLEDDEAIVRNTMSLFCESVKQNFVIPEKARLDFFKSLKGQFEYGIVIGFLTSWALRHLPEVTRDTSDVYERGELNIYAENIPITYAACEVLHKLVWNLEKNKNDKFCMSEHTYFVTQLVLNGLKTLALPMIDSDTKNTVIYCFECILEFINAFKLNIDFCKEFTEFFQRKILKSLREKLTTDYWTVKCFFTYLYNPIMETHFRFPF